MKPPNKTGWDWSDGGIRLLAALVASVAMSFLSACVTSAPRASARTASAKGGEDHIVATIPLTEAPVSQIAIAPDGSRVYVIAGTLAAKLFVIDATARTISATVRLKPLPFRLAISPNGSRAYVVDVSSKALSVVDTQTDSVRETLSLPVAEASPRASGGIAISPDGARVYIAQPDGDILLVDTRTNSDVGRIPLTTFPSEMVLTPDGRSLYVTACTRDLTRCTLLVVDTATKTVNAPIHLERAGKVAIAPGGAAVWVTNGNEIVVVSTATNQVAATIANRVAAGGIAFAPNGAVAYAVGKKSISAIDTGTNAVVGSIHLEMQPFGIVVSLDGRFLWVASSNSVYLISASKWALPVPR